MKVILNVCIHSFIRTGQTKHTVSTAVVVRRHVGFHTWGVSIKNWWAVCMVESLLLSGFSSVNLGSFSVVESLTSSESNVCVSGSTSPGATVTKVINNFVDHA